MKSTKSQNILKSSYLKSSRFDTPLGTMLAVADDNTLLLLDFTDGSNLERSLKNLCSDNKTDILSEETDLIQQVRSELKLYFEGSLKQFKTPLFFKGTAFQQAIWRELIKIPYGQTRSYAEQANLVAKPRAYRAAANANGRNPFSIIVPCHRVINTGGELGGYGGGIHRKQFLLEHEKSHVV